MTPLLERLKQRKLFQWSAAYLAGAWLLLQVLDLLGGFFHWPDRVGQIATTLLGVGFLAALVLAWYHGEKGQQRVTGIELLMLSGILVVAGAAVAFVGGGTTGVGGGAPGPGSGMESAAITAPNAASIGVLPFANLSADAKQEFFADGLTEELLNALSNVPGLRVAARTSSFALKGKELSVQEAAGRLHVAHVLEGSVRTAGDRVRIAAQLIDARDGYQVWSEQYDAELTDIFALQERIARAVAEALRRHIGTPAADAAPLARAGTSDIEAYTLFLQGRFHMLKLTEPDLRRSLELFEAAARRDPAFARAHALAAGAWHRRADDWLPPREAYPRAKAAALRALELDSTLAEAHLELGQVLRLFEWDFAAAERHVRRALALDSTYSEAHLELGVLLAIAGRDEEAEPHLRRSMELDPAQGNQWWAGAVYLKWGRPDDAITVVRDFMTRYDSNWMIGYRVLGDAYLLKGQPDSALVLFRRGLAIDPGLARLRSGEVRALAALGRTGEAHRIARWLEAEAERRYVRAEEIAGAYAALGDRDRAFALLERAHRDRSAGLSVLDFWPMWTPLRGDPRFQAIRRKVGLP